MSVSVGFCCPLFCAYLPHHPPSPSSPPSSPSSLSESLPCPCYDDNISTPQVAYLRAPSINTLALEAPRTITLQLPSLGNRACYLEMGEMGCARFRPGGPPGACLSPSLLLLMAAEQATREELGEFNDSSLGGAGSTRLSVSFFVGHASVAPVSISLYVEGRSRAYGGGHARIERPNQ